MWGKSVALKLWLALQSTDLFGSAIHKRVETLSAASFEDMTG
jgi:hypothetical protein